MKAVSCAILLGILAAIASGATPLPQQATNTLTTIDSVPTREQIDQAFSTSPQTPLQNLTSLATDTDTGSDVGIRLRAIHALGKYCASTPCTDTDPAHVSLTTVIVANQHQSSGSGVLLLRAAIETLGSMGVTDDADRLITSWQLLDHPSRDIRAATARALSDICGSNSPLSTNALRVRYSHESTEQVKLAISEALRILGQCTPNP